MLNSDVQVFLRKLKGNTHVMPDHYRIDSANHTRFKNDMQNYLTLIPEIKIHSFIYRLPDSNHNILIRLPYHVFLWVLWSQLIRLLKLPSVHGIFNNGLIFPLNSNNSR